MCSWWPVYTMPVCCQMPIPASQRLGAAFRFIWQRHFGGEYLTSAPSGTFSKKEIKMDTDNKQNIYRLKKAIIEARRRDWQFHSVNTTQVMYFSIAREYGWPGRIHLENWSLTTLDPLLFDLLTDCMKQLPLTTLLPKRGPKMEL
jgi:hypothetical protein